MSEATQTSGGSKGASPVFVKGFLPGLLVGLVVGLTIGAFVPPLLDRRGPLLEQEPVAPGTGERRERDERRDAFEGTGLPLEDGPGEDSTDVNQSGGDAD